MLIRVLAILAALVVQAHADPDTVRDRLAGMLLGSMIGDALGGPVEFVEADRVRDDQDVFRVWQPGERLPRDLDAYAANTRLLDYARFRPTPEPYAHWEHDAPPGTLTDDSRQKLIAVDMVRDWAARGASTPLTADDLARALLRADTTPLPDGDRDDLSRDWLAEYVLAARYQLGERDPERALPPARLWGGLPTCAGSMLLPPLAGLHPGDPDAAYALAHDVAFIDNGTALDINAGINAGIAAAMTMQTGDPANRADRRQAWADLKAAMLATDPYRYAEVPWVERPLARCLRLGKELAERADRQPAELIRLIRDELKPNTWWEADVVLIMAAAAIELTNAHPVASMKLAIELGYDTDSTAQIAGAFTGALWGESAFPTELAAPTRRGAVRALGEPIDAWLNDLLELSSSASAPGSR